MAKKTQKKMRIILNTSLRNVGKIGEIVNVNPGFFRNFLEPKQYASRYSNEMAEEIKQRQENECRILAAKRSDADKITAFVESVNLKFICQASGTGVLYGSIDRRHIKNSIDEKIHEAIKNNLLSLEDTHFASGYSVRAIEIPKAIKTTGVHSVIVDIFEDKYANLNILIGSNDGDLKALESELQKGAK